MVLFSYNNVKLKCQIVNFDSEVLSTNEATSMYIVQADLLHPKSASLPHDWIDNDQID